MVEQINDIGIDNSKEQVTVTCCLLLWRAFMQHIFPRVLPLLLISLLTLSLAGCSYEEEKNILQTTFDKSNPKGNSAMCIETRGNYQARMNLNEPYETYDVVPGVDRYEYLNRVNGWRNERLAIFAEIGLLNQEKLPNGQYRYTPTDEGRLYISEHDSDRFCFGRVVVTTIKYEKEQDGQSLFTYGYYLENVPNWAKDERLDKINRQIKLILALTPETDRKPGVAWFGSNNQLTSRTFIASWIY